MPDKVADPGHLGSHAFSRSDCGGPVESDEVVRGAPELILARGTASKMLPSQPWNDMWPDQERAVPVLILVLYRDWRPYSGEQSL
jgi:hypothetical protein